MNTPTIEQKFSDQVSYIEAGGIAYSGTSTGTYSALLACAPGSAPSNRGGIEMPQGLALASQSQLVGMVGNVWANLNSRLPKISMEMSENLGNLDIAPQESVKMNILATDTPANIPVDGLYLPDSITWHYDAKGQILFPSIDFKNLVNGTLAEAINTPASVAEAGFDGGGFSVPQLQIPPLPMLTIPPSLSAAIDSTVGRDCLLLTADASSYTIKKNRGSLILQTLPNIGNTTILEVLCPPGLYEITAEVGYLTSVIGSETFTIIGAGYSTIGRQFRPFFGVSDNPPYSIYPAVSTWRYSSTAFTVQLTGGNVRAFLLEFNIVRLSS